MLTWILDIFMLASYSPSFPKLWLILFLIFFIFENVPFPSFFSLKSKPRREKWGHTNTFNLFTRIIAKINRFKVLKLLEPAPTRMWIFGNLVSFWKCKHCVLIPTWQSVIGKAAAIAVRTLLVHFKFSDPNFWRKSTANNFQERWILIISSELSI